MFGLLSKLEFHWYVLVSEQGVSVFHCKQPTDSKSKGIEKYNIFSRKTLFFCSVYIFFEISGQ